MKTLLSASAKKLEAITPVAFSVPALATDCHVHVFDPERFSYSPARRYTPPPATLDTLSAFHAQLGMQRRVLVQPSVYGTDNSCLLAALSRLGSSARGVAVIDENTSQTELSEMVAQGVRGVRINLEVGNDRNTGAAVTRFLKTQEQVAPHRLVIQIYTALPVIVALAPHVVEAQVPVLFDHFGLAQAGLGAAQEGFEVLIALLKGRKAHVKLSGPHQISTQASTYRDTTEVASPLAHAEPSHVVWGSDWPHTGGKTRPKDYLPTQVELFHAEDDGYNLNLLQTWVPEPELRELILVDNPARLFHF